MWEQCDLGCLLRFVCGCAEGVVLFSPPCRICVARAAPMQAEPGDDASEQAQIEVPAILARGPSSANTQRLPAVFVERMSSSACTLVSATSSVRLLDEDTAHPAQDSPSGASDASVTARTPSAVPENSAQTPEIAMAPPSSPGLNLQVMVRSTDVEDEDSPDLVQGPPGVAKIPPPKKWLGSMRGKMSTVLAKGPSPQKMLTPMKAPRRKTKFSDDGDEGDAGTEATKRVPARKPKILRMMADRASSRKLVKQPQRWQNIADMAGGGHLRYGAFRFRGTTGAPTIWTCIAKGAPESSIATVRWDIWHQARPTLLISLAGYEPNTCSLDARKEYSLLAGLSKAVNKTGAWILTDGVRDSTGGLIDRLVDDWVDERTPPVCIGLRSWESVDPRVRSEVDTRPDGTPFHFAELRSRPGSKPDHFAELCQKHKFLLFHKTVFNECHDDEDSPFPGMPVSRLASAPTVMQHTMDSTESLEDDALRKAAHNRWRDMIAFQEHICRVHARAALNADEFSFSGRGTDEPATCGVLICLGGDLTLLERVLCHLVAIRMRPESNLGAIIVFADSGGASGDLYDYFGATHSAKRTAEAFGVGTPMEGAFSPSPIEGGARADSPDSMHEHPSERRLALLRAIAHIADEHEKANKGRKAFVFVRANDQPHVLCDQILNAALDGCTVAMDRILHAVAWTESHLVEEQLRQVPRIHRSSCLAPALLKALLLSLSKTDADSVVKLLLDYHAPVAELSFWRLFDSQTHKIIETRDGGWDSSDDTFAGETSQRDAGERSVRSVRSGARSTSVGNEGTQDKSPNKKRLVQRRGSTLPDEVFFRRATLGVRLSAVALEPTSKLAPVLDEHVDPFEILCRAIRGGKLITRTGLWNMCGYNEHVAARRAIQEAEAITTPQLTPLPSTSLWRGVLSLSRTRTKSLKKSSAGASSSALPALQQDSAAVNPVETLPAKREGPPSLGNTRGAASLDSTTSGDDSRSATGSARRKTVTLKKVVTALQFGVRKKILSAKPKLSPNSTDLLLWAVVKGKHTLVRRIWEQTDEPLRAAIMASRLCKHLQNAKISHGHQTDFIRLNDVSLESQGDEYERWATGLLSRMPHDRQLIMDLLTRAPARQLGQGDPIRIWENSVLDEATERMYPALTFVAHPHCQNVLTNYWHGNYCGSHAAITKSDLHMLLLQIVLQVVYTIIACLGGFACGFPPPFLNAVETFPPEYRTTAPLAEDSTSQVDDKTEDDEFCRAYFSSTVAKQRDRMKTVHKMQQQPRRSTFNRVLSKTRKVFTLTRAATRYFTTEVERGLETPESDAHTMRLEMRTRLLFAFWTVPKVLFAVDAIFRFTLLALQIILATGHLWIPEWMAKDSESGRPYYLNDFVPPLNVHPTRVAAEVVTFIFALGRIAENLKFRWNPFVFYAFMRRFDLIACYLFAGAFIARIFIMASGNDQGALRYTHDLFAVSTFFLCFTILRVLAYQRTMGTSLMTLFEMIWDSSSVLVIIFVTVVAFGVSAVALLPGAFMSSDANSTFIDANTTSTWPTAQVDRNQIFTFPGFLGAYAILGLLDIGMFIDLAESGAATNSTSLAALLLFLFCFFVTVFVMNLLIAKMASRYDVIERRFQEYRHFQHIALIKRYKDGGLPPPFNLISLLTSGVRKIMLRCGASDEKMDRPAERFTVYSGPVATRQSSRIERTYLRDFLREEEAKRTSEGLATTSGEDIQAGLAVLRQSFTERFDQIEGSLRMTSHRSKSFDSQSTPGPSPKHRSDASVGKAVKFRATS